MRAFFEKICQKIIRLLDPESKCSDLERLQMYFAIQTIAYNVSVIFLILLLSYCIGSFRETLLLFCIFGGLRILAGGFHFDSAAKCIAATTIIMLGEGKLAQYIQINLPVCLLLCLFSGIVLFFHIPRGTKNNPYSEEYSHLQKKRLRIVTVLFSLCAVCFLTLRTVFIFAMVTVALFILPDLFHRFQAIE